MVNRRRRSRSRSWLAVLGMATVLCASAGRAAGLVSEDLVVAGAVKAALTLTVSDLRAFPADQSATITVKRRVDDKETVSNVRGVRLTAVLDKAGLLSTDQNDWKHTIVLATASDGYRVVFSWPELFNSEAGSAVLVVYERDGQPLPDREGRIALVSGRDLRTGPRSVRWLTRIDVRVVKE
jgi:DMSO/TMAO reductase YedYZ molybdopterin-dependent catalytic subunit